MAEVRVFISSAGSQVINGGATATFEFFQPLDDAYWDLSVVPVAANRNIEILRIFVDSDASGVRRMHYVLRNNTSSATSFTRAAIRAPE